jgi:hypothetical protein
MAPAPIFGYEQGRLLERSMSDTGKLSVNKALEKLRRADAKATSASGRSARIDALNEEAERLRTMRARLTRDRKGASGKPTNRP